MSKNLSSKLDSYALMIIALLAVVVSIWQVSHQRKHDRISMMPYVSWDVETVGDSTMIKLWNKGAGPALIKEYNFSINDSTFGSWSSAFKFADSTIKIYQEKIFGNYTLAPNEVLILVAYKKGLYTDHNIRINIGFESVYGDKKEDYLMSTL
ncbi:hypothetical protein [Roseivirga misakiensis]|uniref:LTD domain-containing protein n=1 Tax=Roseivirga misakiensis TaxID=1563681 RepID=A0A1E5SK89_9BACT|nr:hypothetical protein [Roseivirga misakiensis]OEJ99544.1 hypothetical protein BFP71_08170 [Roseivirga misakiensis]